MGSYGDQMGAVEMIECTMVKGVATRFLGRRRVSAKLFRTGVQETYLI